MIFASELDSHQHSLDTLNHLNSHYDFKISVGSVLDVGCALELMDLRYWANLTDELNINDPNKPLNINCVGLSNLDIPKPTEKNIKFKKQDFNTGHGFGEFKTQFDVVWCHDVMQYSWNPIWFLNNINQVMSDGAMLYLCVPSTVNVLYNKFTSYTPSHCYNTFTITQILYLLALNGFEIKDFHIKKEPFVDIIEAVTYKNTEPLDYNTTWYDLLEKDLLSDSMAEIVQRNGYLSNQGLISKWLDGTVYDYRYESR